MASDLRTAIDVPQFGMPAGCGSCGGGCGCSGCGGGCCGEDNVPSPLGAAEGRRSRFAVVALSGVRASQLTGRSAAASRSIRPPAS